MNKWLQRALVSAGAAVVSTTAIVTTAESSDGKKKKRKKRKRGDKKRERDESFEGRGADGAIIDDDVPRSMGAQAAHDYRTGHDGGLTAGEWVENVKGLGTKARDGASTLGSLLFGKGPPPGEAPPAGEGKKRSKKRRRRRVRRKKGEAPPEPEKRKKRKRADAPVDDDVSRLKDEAKKQATKAAVNSLADKAGVADAVETLKEQGKELWHKTEKLGEAVREKVPDDLGERVGESLVGAGRAIKDGANKLGEKVKAAVGDDDDDDDPAEARDGAPGDAEPNAADDDLASKVGRGIQSFTRWVEGPGAPDYDAPDYEAAPAPSRVKPADSDGDEDEQDVVEAKDPDSPLDPPR
jgi:hypothetical protein